MSTQCRIWLGLPGEEQLLPLEGRTFTETEFEITREERMASGRLRWDIIAVKKQFTLEYGLVTGETLALLKTLYQAGQNKALNLRVERQDASIDTYSVRFRPFSRRRYLMDPDKWFWKDITLVLEEI